jgi:hypothetical protein
MYNWGVQHMCPSMGHPPAAVRLGLLLAALLHRRDGADRPSLAAGIVDPLFGPSRRKVDRGNVGYSLAIWGIISLSI